jgi:hypothetical protein
MVFKKATTVISGSKYPTSNLYFHEMWSVKEVLEKESSSPNPIVAKMVVEMRQSLRNIGTSHTYQIAYRLYLILDSNLDLLSFS